MVKVVVFSGHSLYADGVTRRLQQFPGELDVRVIDRSEIGALGIIVSACPAVLILEKSSAEREISILQEMMTSIPDLKVIVLDPATSNLQVVQWENRQVERLIDLVDLLR